MYSVQRPIYEDVDKLLENHQVATKKADTFINKYQDSGLPIFGSFGLAARYKVAKCPHIINQQYDNAVIKINMPRAHFYAEDSSIKEVRHCLSIPRKPGIILLIHNKFLSNEDLLTYLNSNTMNVFLYDKMGGSKNCISSVIDVALGVRKPLAISDSDMFRNIYDDKICLYKTPISKILETSVEHCEKFREQYSHKM